MKVQIVIFDGFDELDAIAPWEVFRSATVIGAEVQVKLIEIPSLIEELKWQIPPER